MISNSIDYLASKGVNFNFNDFRPFLVKEWAKNPDLYNEDFECKFKYYVYIFFDKYEKGFFGGKCSDGKTSLFLEGEPFYVGKGTGSRCLNHFNERRKHVTPFYCKLNSLINEKPSLAAKDLISVVKFFEREEEAYEFETFLIKEIGSDYIDEVKDGPLKNMTLDSQPPNHKGKTYNEIYGEKASEQIERRTKLQIEAGGYFKGRKHTQESKDKISQKGLERYREMSTEDRKMSEETKKLISAKRKESISKGEIPARKESWVLISPKGEKINIEREEKMRIEDKCKELNICYSALSKARRSNKPIEKGRTRGWELLKTSEIKNFDSLGDLG